MSRKKSFKTGYNRIGDELIVKIRDMTNHIFYKKRVSMSDVKGMKELIIDLDAYGLDLKQIMEQQIKEKEKRWW